MKLVINHSKSAAFNMACEEYFMNHTDEDIFMLWASVDTILIGKNQNTYTEINVPYVNEHDIKVVRRMSGGGTVFCDGGNVNFAFIDNDPSQFTNFKKFTEPVVAFLNSLGVKAAFSGRNDLQIEDKKFSGNAQYRMNQKTLHHGTLLFDSSISHLSNALTPRPEKFTDKAVTSVISRVTTIKPHLDPTYKDLTIDAFNRMMYDFMATYFEDAKRYELTEEDIQAINAIAEAKYNTWEWNYGHSPKYDYFNVKKYPCGLVEVGLTVKKGLITDCQISGDFFSSQEISQLSHTFVGLKHEPLALANHLETITLNEYIAGMAPNDLVQLMTEV